MAVSYSPPLQPAAAIQLGCCPGYAAVSPRDGDLRQTLSVEFPALYFQWCKDHLREQLLRPPSYSTDPMNKVLWALDVWATVQYAVLALNQPMRHLRGRGRAFGAKPGEYEVSPHKAPHGTGSAPGTYAQWEGAIPHGGASGLMGNGGPLQPHVPPTGVARRFADAIKAFYDDAGFARQQELSRIAREPGSADWKASAKSAPLMPAPFMTMVQFWTMENHGSKLWDMLATQCLPWMATGLRLPSKGNKDADEWARAPAFSNSLAQWRLWSLRDFYPWSARAKWVRDHAAAADPIRLDWTARGMGPIDNTASLTQYVMSVQSEHRGAEVRYTNSAFYPTLQYVIQSGLPRLAKIVISMDYGGQVREHVTRWFQSSAPPFTAGGQVQSWGAEGGALMGKPKPVGLSDQEWRQLYAGQIAQVQAGLEAKARAGVDNPAGGCRDPQQANLSGDAAAQCEQIMGSSSQMAEQNPYTKVARDAQKSIANFLIGQGMAVGSTGYFPFYPLDQPFTRSAPAGQPYATTVQGPSIDIGARVNAAIVAIQFAIGVQLSPWQSLQRTSLPQPRAGFDPASCPELIAAAQRKKPWVVLTEQEQAQLLAVCQAEARKELPAGAALGAWAVLERQKFEEAGGGQLQVEQPKRLWAWGLAAAAAVGAVLVVRR